MVKDATVVKLYLEVYHLVVTLLYIAVVSGSVSGEEVKESEIWNHAEDANGALKHLVKDQHEVHYADVDQLKSHEYIIGKFLKENLRAAVGKPQDVAKLGMAVKQLNALVGDATMTSAARDARQKVIESSITKCLDDKFHQHVVFHYLVIVVGSQPGLLSMLTRVAKLIRDKSSSNVWSCLSLLRGYCNLCEICNNEDLIKAITAKDSYFRKLIEKYRKRADRLCVVTDILSAILFHPSLLVRELASCSLRRGKDGVLTPLAADSVTDACRKKIEKVFSSKGLVLEPENTKIEGLSSNECVLLKGKFGCGGSVFCKFPSPQKWVSGDAHSSVAVSLKKEFELLRHLHQNPSSVSHNVIALHSTDAECDVCLPYYLFSCDEPDTNLSEYLVRCVREGRVVPLQERVGLSVDVLSAVHFCNTQNVLLRHICAHAFLLTRRGGQAMARLANFGYAHVGVNHTGKTSCYGESQ
ncbi:hypothetical protein NP493_1617g00001 [Ridgeia piscesae]|uniref:Uncharacterized protein n=1 Tax=Ridgeia piscesae TaxID=27915 RepID=A0AAD9N8E3_RIDPI|nr:hypothetical protein NP493_1617g00001 [Ridgeia piscesae]